MSTSKAVHLEPQYLRIVREILHEHVPGRRVWVFGSRATGVRMKQFSDLDIAISGKLTLAETGALAEAFEESLLPIKVDLVSLEGISSDFAERIRADFVSLPMHAQGE